MAFRNLLIRDRCKLDYSLNYLICKKENESIKILIDEIKIIYIESTQVSITTCLISKLIENKVKVIFCNSEHNPAGEIVSYQNNYYSYRKIKEQISFSSNQEILWKEIVKQKIYYQAKNLQKQNHIDEYNLLMDYYECVELNDSTNREGHAAKVYFNSLFGKDFNRRDDKNKINKYLNYGYSILISSLNREIKMLGYLTELGIHHIGDSNSFNLSYDLIEPLRALVDSYVVKEIVNEDNYKKIFIDMLSEKVTYNNQDTFLDNAIHLYVINIFDYLKTNKEEYIKFIKYEL